jgi:hypothetical protein
MADDTSPSFQAGSSFESGEEQGQRSEEQSQRSEGQGQRGGRGPGNREPGGFRIRLSDNEMRAARAVQEAFRLRSTVAALGFSIRTVAQLLEDGQLSELVAQQQAQAGAGRDDAPRAAVTRGDGARREGRGEGRSEGRGEGARGLRRLDGRQERAARIDPFARPAKPAPAAAAEELAAGDADQLGDENLASEQFDSPVAEAADFQAGDSQAGDSQASDAAQLEPVTDTASEA